MIKYHFQEHLLCSCNNQFCLISLGIVISKSFRREWDKLPYWFLFSTCAHMHLHTYAPMQPCSSALIHICTHSPCIHASIYTCILVPMQLCTHASMHPCTPMQPINHSLSQDIFVICYIQIYLIKSNRLVVKIFESKGLWFILNKEWNTLSFLAYVT